MKYKATLDALGKVTTALISIIFISIISVQITSITTNHIALPLGIIAVIVLGYTVAFLYSPQGYSISNNSIMIHRMINNVTIYKNQISSVVVVEDSKVTWVFRTFGVGGLFGYWGKFSNSTLGSMSWYASRRKNLLLITMVNTKKIIISPDAYIDFVNDYNQPSPE